MATDPFLLERIQLILMEKNIAFEEKRMFGGHCFMVNDKMCFGTYKGGLMARVGIQNKEELLPLEGAKEMDKMKAFLLINAEGIDRDAQLEFWIQKCLDFNPFAEKSKKRKAKRTIPGS